MSGSYTGQRFAVRRLYPEDGCAGPAAVAEAFPLDRCLPYPAALDGVNVSFLFAVEGGGGGSRFVTRTSPTF